MDKSITFMDLLGGVPSMEDNEAVGRQFGISTTTDLHLSFNPEKCKIVHEDSSPCFHSTSSRIVEQENRIELAGSQASARMTEKNI